LKELFSTLLKTIKELMETYGQLKFEFDDAKSFELALLTLCLFCIGGQRREYIVGMYLKVFIEISSNFQ
jgi:hypothetical protein